MNKVRKCSFFVFALLTNVVLAISAQELPRKFGLGMIYSVEEIKSDTQLQRNLRVHHVYAGSMSNRLSIQVNDLIVQYNGVSFSDSNSIARFFVDIKAIKQNDTIRLQVQRNKEQLTFVGKADVLPYETTAGCITQYSQVASGINLHRAIINRPLQGESLPAVLIMQGLPCRSLDSPFDENGTYRKLASELAKKGFLVLRVEKSGVGDSEGVPCNVIGFNDEVDSFKKGLELLKNHPDVNKNKIFVFGHSTGGFMAPLVADNNVAGIITYGTLSRTWFDYWLQIRLLQLRQARLDTTTVSRERRKICTCTKAFLEEKKSLEVILKDDKACERHLQMFMLRSEKFWREADRVDITAQWLRYDGKVLALWGSSDNLILREDQSYIADLINRKCQGNGAFKIITDTDHHFVIVRNDRMLPASREFNNDVVEVIARWILSPH